MKITMAPLTNRNDIRKLILKISFVIIISVMHLHCRPVADSATASVAAEGRKTHTLPMV